MISRVGRAVSRLSERFVPSPFVLALFLTLLTFVVGFGFGREMAGLGAFERMSALWTGWYADFYGTGLMKFALQMCIVLITGHALAQSRPVRRGIEAIAGVAQSPRTAVFVVALVACLASLVQWGLGAIVGAFMAREMGRAFDREDRKVHYPLLGAAGYAGFLVWHSGFSGSAPLKVAEEGHFVEGLIGVVPVAETLLSPLNLVVTGTMLVVIPSLFWALMPTDPDRMTLPEFDHGDSRTDPAEPSEAKHPVVRQLEHGRALNVAVAGLLFGFLGYFFGTRGLAGWNLDSINLLFLATGIGLYPSPDAYADAIADGIRGAAGIILQFPFYFGILGLLKASGLIAQIAEFFVQISTEATFPIFTFLAAGFVNFLVPSGGGQWAVQGEVMMQAAKTLGVAPREAIMAFSYGDAWTNMLQPFWALPLLGIMELEARDIIGYTVLVMLVTGPIIMSLLYLI